MIEQIINDMIVYSNNNLHDISHFMAVYNYACLIADSENISAKDKETLEIAAIIHDIACPLCRIKYGNTNGKYQEIEGEKLAFDFLQKYEGIDINRIVYLVSHHHTFTNVIGIDYQILLEADAIQNGIEGFYTIEQMKKFKENVFKTKTGINFLRIIFNI